MIGSRFTDDDGRLLGPINVIATESGRCRDEPQKIIGFLLTVDEWARFFLRELGCVDNFRVVDDLRIMLKISMTQIGLYRWSYHKLVSGIKIEMYL